VTSEVSPSREVPAVIGIAAWTVLTGFRRGKMMTDEQLYAVVGGRQLHEYPAHEECNLDDATVVQRNLTRAEVDVLEEVSGPFERCKHCWPRE